MESKTNQGLLDAMLARNLKISLGDGGFLQGGLVSEGSGGLGPPTLASRKS